MDARAFGKAISSFSCIFSTRRQEDVLLFRKYVLNLIALVAPEGHFVMIGTLTVRVSSNAKGQHVCRLTAASVQVTDKAGRWTTALLRHSLQRIRGLSPDWPREEREPVRIYRSCVNVPNTNWFSFAKCQLELIAYLFTFVKFILFSYSSMSIHSWTSFKLTTNEMSAEWHAAGRPHSRNYSNQRILVTLVTTVATTFVTF